MEKNKVQAFKNRGHAADQENIDSLNQKTQAGSKMNLSPTIKLVSHGIPHETIRALELTLSEAKKGQVAGVMLCIMYGNKEIDIANTDEFYRNPYLGRAIAAELDDYLSEQTKDQRMSLK